MKPMILFLLLAACDPARVTVVGGETGTTREGANTDGDTSDTDENLPPEDIKFEEVGGGMGGMAANVEGEAWFIYGGTVLHVTDIWTGDAEKLLDTSPDGINCVHSYAVEAIGRKIYVLGGQFGSDQNCDKPEGASDEVWEIDTEAATATRIASMKKPREVLSSGVVDGKIWVLGGWQPKDNLSGSNEHTVEVFDGTSWETVTTFGSWNPIRSAASATVGKKIYLFGGCEEGAVTDLVCPCSTQHVQIFDTETRTFSRGADMPLSGRHFSGQHAVARGRYIYVFGGASDFSCCTFDDVARYDTETDTWKMLTDRMTAERKGVGAVLYQDYLLVYGGVQALSEEQCQEGSCDEGCSASGVGTNEVGTFVADTESENQGAL